MSGRLLLPDAFPPHRVQGSGVVLPGGVDAEGHLFGRVLVCNISVGGSHLPQWRVLCRGRGYESTLHRGRGLPLQRDVGTDYLVRGLLRGARDEVMSW